MLDLLFGLNARISRLNYFLATIALAVLMTAVAFAIATSLFYHASIAALQPRELMSWPVIAAVVFFLVASFTLQSMRIRDIGWDPVCIIPAWIAILVIDGVVAGKIPAWAIDQHHETIFGAGLNLVSVLVLTFWPGDGSVPDVTTGLHPLPKAKLNSGVSAARLASVTRSETWQG